MSTKAARIARILVPLTSILPHDNVLALAEQLAQLFESEVHLLHKSMVDRTNPGQRYMWLLAEAEDANRPHMDGDPEPRAHPLEQRVVHEHLDESAGVASILDYAERIEAGLIIQETYGHMVLGKLVFGGLSEELVRHATCPVLSVRKRNAISSPSEFRNILVPVDFSRYTAPLLSFAALISSLFKAHVHVVHVIQPPAYPWFPLSVHQHHASEEEAHKWEEAAQTALEEQIAKIPEAKGEWTRSVRIGHPSAELLRYADEAACDLILCPSHGRTDNKDFNLGSVAEKLVRRAPHAVMTLKSDFLERSIA